MQHRLSIDPPSHDDLVALVTPFVAPFDETQWEAAVQKLRRKVDRRKPADRGGRDQADVVAAWGAKWAKAGDPKWQPGGKVVPCFWADRKMLIEVPGIHRAKLFYAYRIIEQLKPSSVLEVGSGNGINLLLLANRFPELSFSGIELTQSGADQSKHLQSEALPEDLAALSPEPLLSDNAHRSVVFEQGDAASLPFADNAFDLVLTMQALEQMERIREAALGEIARVCADAAVMIEPFKDFNRRGLKRDYTEGVGYLQAFTGDLPRFGLHPIYVTSDLPQKANLGVGVVAAEKGAVSNASGLARLSRLLNFLTQRTWATKG